MKNSPDRYQSIRHISDKIKSSRISSLILLIFLFLSTVLSAQVPITNEVNFRQDSVTCRDFIKYMEYEHSLRFFYDPEWFKSKNYIPVDFIKKDLKLAVKEFFKSFDLEVFFQENNVFISNGLIIEPGLADNFIKNLTEAREKIKIKDLISQNTEDAQTGTVNPEFEMIRFGAPTSKLKDRKFHLTGSITEPDGNNPVIGATVQIAGTTLGAISDLKGKYDLIVTAGQYEVIYRAIGKVTTKRQISLYSDGKVDLSLNEEAFAIEEVQVVARRNDRVNTMVGAENLDISMMKKSIMNLGEPDIIKGILTLTGVQAATEVSTGFNVRGGSTDQNLILLDNVPVMNVTHFFGFFSAFNSDLIEKATLYKSGIPSSLGGRISSIFDISSRKGNREKFAVSGGISPFTGRLTMEGPIIKEKLSFIVGGRSTYSDWILKRIEDPRINNSLASFYDIFGNVSYDISKKHKLYFTVYNSEDYFKFDQISSNEYSNLAFSLNYEATLGPKLLFKNVLTSSKYRFGMTEETIPSMAKKSVYEINQYGLKSTFNYKLSDQIDLNYGLNAIIYNSVPGIVNPFNQESLIIPLDLETEKAVEGALFIHNEQKLTDWLSFSYGLRYSLFGNLGPRTVFEYDPAFSKSLLTVTDTVSYASNELIKHYSGIEPRFLAKIRTGSNSSVKLSYNRTKQYINLIFNTVSPAPTDIWKLSDYNFVPQTGDQISIGYYKDFIGTGISLCSVSLEAYYKSTHNILDYKVGAELFANEHFETEIMNGMNKSYGIEMQVIKETGSLNGWFNYTFSRSLNRFNSPWLEETINLGEFFPANYDKPHNIKAVINYDFYRRLRMSANFNYSSGRPVTLPQTAFNFGNSTRVQFSERNHYRMPEYFRLDLSATIESDHRVKKVIHSSFTLSVINITGRRNPYSIFYDYDRFRRLKAYSLSIYGAPIASLTYNFRF